MFSVMWVNYDIDGNQLDSDSIAEYSSESLANDHMMSIYDQESCRVAEKHGIRHAIVWDNGEYSRLYVSAE